MLGETRLIECARVVPPRVCAPVAPTFALAMAIEVSRRHPRGTDEWAPGVWARVAELLAGALRVRPGPAGSIVAAWSLEGRESIADAADLALELSERFAAGGVDGAELRGGVAIGIIDGPGHSRPVERCAERLALAAAPGQWLVTHEAARRLEQRFELRGVGIVPRWPIRVPEGYRALVARLAAPELPSAVSGAVPEFVLGRASERRRLLAEIQAAAAGRRRVVLVSAPAGGGKSHLLRRVLADSGVTVAAGVAFRPFGSRPLDPVLGLLRALGADGCGGLKQGPGTALAEAADRQARTEPSAIVIDDVHWADSEAVGALATAIASGEDDVPLVWVLSMRTAGLGAVDSLVRMADLRVELPPLRPADRARLLAPHLGTVPEGLRAHVSAGQQRGNPLFLEHLAEAIREGCTDAQLPGTLHEAVLMRLGGLSQRARGLTRWPSQSLDPGRELKAIESEVGDWLDRLETTDVADLATIGRYLARLQTVDVDLVIARSVLGMPVSANRRLAWAVERLAGASTDALLDYLETMVREGREPRAAHEAREAAERAERALRLADAERLLKFASTHDPQCDLARKRGDLALALGRPDAALRSYRAAALARGGEAPLERRTARAEALLGDVEGAVSRLEALLRRPAIEPVLASRAALDLARLRGAADPASSEAEVIAGRRASRATDSDAGELARRIARTRAWVRAGEADPAMDAIRGLVLTGEPVACAAELIDVAALSRFAGLNIAGLDAAAMQAAQELGGPHALNLLTTTDVADARRTFIHWDV